MKKGLVVLCALIGLTQVGCDADGDGLSNAKEKELGLDPKNEDVDGDGLLDGEDPNPSDADIDGDHLNDFDEVAAGTDPSNPDTDDDGYLDGDEVLEGSDPLDKKSKIYKGGWPYNRFKDDLSQNKVTDTIEVGGRMPRFELKDQFGETVDLYDFAGQGKDIVIDLSALNCGPCLMTAEWMDTGGDEFLEDAFGDLRKGVKNDEVYWLTVAYTSYFSPSESNTGVVDEWYGSFPTKNIPVLADDQLEMWDYAWQGGMPFFAHLNDKLVVQSYDLGIGPGVAPLEGAQDSL